MDEIEDLTTAINMLKTRIETLVKQKHELIRAKDKERINVEIDRYEVEIHELNKEILVCNEEAINLMNKKNKLKFGEKVKKMNPKEVRKMYYKKYREFIERRRELSAELRAMVGEGKQMRENLGKLAKIVKLEAIGQEDEAFLKELCGVEE